MRRRDFLRMATGGETVLTEERARDLIDRILAAAGADDPATPSTGSPRPVSLRT
jgi:hypothetical protein